MIEKNKPSATIIGCGWLGLPLGIKLAAMGWQVFGSTTRKEKIAALTHAGIEPFLLKWPDDIHFDSKIFGTDYMVLNVPPGRNDPSVMANYPKLITQILAFLRSTNSKKKIIFVSSTSVYGDDEDVLDENSACNPGTNSGRVLLKSENMIRESGLPYIILRFGGLAGGQRHPGRFLAGRKGIDIGEQAVNFLHLKDGIHVIYYMLTHPIENETFNVVAPLHPSKREFYTKMTSILGLEVPTFVKGTIKKKKEVSVLKLLSRTKYEFMFADPMRFSYDLPSD